ncbi:MAG: YqaJ viral recombinase family protein [Rhodanobacter sp.]
MNAQLAPLSETRGYIGGGNIAGILGLSPFKSPLDEYLTITSELPVELSPQKKEFFEDRRDLEPWAAKKFTRRTGLQVVRTNVRYDDAEFAWAKAEIDFEPDEDDATGETKTVHPNAVGQWGDPEEDEEPPLYVTAQAMWGLGVTGKRKCYVNALIGFDDHRVYVVNRDDELIANMRAHAARFWKYHIEPRRMPQPTTIEDLLRLYARDSGRAVEAAPEICKALTDICTERQVIKLHESRRDTYEYQIKAFMRDATTLLVSGQPVLTWKARTDGVRVFRIR